MCVSVKTLDGYPASADGEKKGAETQAGMVKLAFCFTYNLWTFYVENAFIYHLCS